MKTNINGIEVEGIKIDNSTVERLKDYQNGTFGDNGLERDLRYIADAIIYLGSLHFVTEGHDQVELHRAIWGLSKVARSIKSFSPYYHS